MFINVVMPINYSRHVHEQVWTTMNALQYGVEYGLTPVVTALK